MSPRRDEAAIGPNPYVGPRPLVGGEAAIGPNPYVGPRPLVGGERLFGREREVRELHELLCAERVVLLHAPSGAGKSSLIHAGLLPRLRGRFDVWRTARVGRPLPAEAAAAANRPSASVIQDLEQGVPEGLRRPPAALAGQSLAAYVAGRPRRPGAPDRLLLVFDQFEEILTVDPLDLAARRAFFAELAELLQDPRVWALFALREDYLAPLAPYADSVPTHLLGRYRIDALDLEGARAAITGPLVGGARRWTDAAAERLLRDLAAVNVQQPDGTFAVQVGARVEPMQLQVVCRALWERMPADDLTIDVADIDAFGDVTRALAVYYADELRRVCAGDAAVERDVRGWVGERLVGADGVRRPVLRGAVRSDGLANAWIDRLVDAHLVRAERRDGATWYELAHDRLIQPLRLDNERWTRQNLAPEQVQAALWLRRGRPGALLLPEAALVEAERRAAARTTALAGPDAAFLAASRVAVDRARAVRAAEAEALRAAQDLAAEQARAAARQRRWIAAIGAIGLVAAVGLVYANDRAALSDARTRMAEASRRGAAEQALRARDHALMIAAREAGGDPTVRAALVREVVRPDAARRWQLAVDHALSVQLARDIVVHPRKLSLAAWAPDGRGFVTASHDHTARVHRLGAAGPASLVAELASEGPVLAAAFSPDGARVAVAGAAASAPRVRVWSADGAGPPVVLAGHEQTIVDLAFSPDGARIVTASLDGTARVWPVDGRGPPVVLAGHDGVLTSAEFSPDGGRVATGSEDASVRVWPAGGGAPVVLDGHGTTAYAVAFTPDGARVLTLAADDTARVWPADGAGPPTILGGSGVAYDARLMPDGGHVVTGSRDGNVRVWPLDGGAARVLYGEAPAQLVAPAPDGRAIAVASGASLALWPTDGLGPPRTFAGHAGPITSVRFSPDGRHLLTAAGDGTARVWPTAPPAWPRVLRGHTRAVELLELAADGRRALTASADGTARVWPLVGDDPPIVLAGHAGELLSVSFSPDGARALTGGADGAARVWSVDGRASVVLRGHQGPVSCAAFSPDGARVVTASWDGTARVWSADGVGEPRVLAGHGDRLTLAGFSPDGRWIVTASLDRSARLWPVDGGAPRVLAGHAGPVGSARFSPGGERLATAEDNGAVRVWRTDAEAPPVVLPGPTFRLYDAVFSPDGRRLATAGSDNVTRIWPADGVGEPVLLRTHRGAVNTVAFTADGARVLTASADGTAAIHRVDGGLERQLYGHDGAVTAAAFTPDERAVVTASADATVRVWALRGAEESQAALWRATAHCLPVEQRVARLGETAAQAARGRDACVAEVAAQQASR